MWERYTINNYILFREGLLKDTFFKHERNCTASLLIMEEVYITIHKYILSRKDLRHITAIVY